MLHRWIMLISMPLLLVVLSAPAAGGLTKFLPPALSPAVGRPRGDSLSQP